MARDAVDLDLDSVMFDGSFRDYEENVATPRVADYVDANGDYVEAELGRIGGKDGAHAFGARTVPAEAKAFTSAIGVDALAVAVDSCQAMTGRGTSLDIELIAQLHETVGASLVLHCSSGVRDEQLVFAITNGTSQINVSTPVDNFFTRAVYVFLRASPQAVDSRLSIGAGREARAVEAARLAQLFWLADTRRSA